VSSQLAGRAMPIEHPDRVSAVGKVVQVVEALTQQSGISEISRTTGLPTSTVHRIIQELVAVGWVRGNGEGGYFPGAGLLTLAARAEAESRMTDVIIPLLQGLRDLTSHTIHFALRQGDQVVYVAKIEGLRAYEMRSRVGMGIPLHCTAIGKAVLAALPERDVRSLLRRTGMPQMGPRTITDPDALVKHLAVISRQGFSVDDEENEALTRCIGAVVRDHRGGPVGGISMSGMAFEIDQRQVREMAPHVVAVAREISHALGYQEGQVGTRSPLSR
jgi:IclR family acetate operon transcriptional repressor